MRRLIIACDGTRQYDVLTNIKRLHYALPWSSSHYVIYTQSGLGPEDLDSISLLKAYAYTRVFGLRIHRRIVDAYFFLMGNYRPGDKIFIFGFSRGAFVARVLADFVARVGIYKTAKAKYERCYASALKAYKDGTLDRDIERYQYDITEDGERVLKVHRVEIEVLGCWDTVGSLGFPWSGAGDASLEFKYLSPTLVKGIRHAFHALALDEYRRTFSPTMWYLPKGAEVAKTIDLQQCWFPGAHRNVGGAYHDQALADLSFFWMLDRCRPFLDFDPEYIKYVVDTHYQSSQSEDDSDRPSRLDHVDGYDMEYQGWGRERCYDSYRLGGTWLWKYRTPGAYGGGDEGTNLTNESIHPSVRARWQSSREDGGELKDGPGVYAPEALRGFEPREGANRQWEWVKKVNEAEVLTIPEENRKEVLVNLEVPFPT